MRELVGEHYLPAEAAKDAGDCAKAARAAADQLRREGRRVHHVHHVRSILIPEDETCIDLYRAESINAVRAAAARASLRLDRLTGAVSSTGVAA